MPQSALRKSDRISTYQKQCDFAINLVISGRHIWITECLEN